MFYPSDMTTNGELSNTEPLDAQRISEHLVSHGAKWTQVSVLQSVDSTNSHISRAMNAVTQGNPLVVMAEEQTSGLGRLGRAWSSQFGKGIALSIGLHRSDFGTEPSTLPLIVGLAVHKALKQNDVFVNLKWPNDLVFLGQGHEVRKCGGILVQNVHDVFIIGIGLNVSHNEAELPTETATSLLVEGYEVERNLLVANIVCALADAVQNSDTWQSEYTAACASIGRSVIVHQGAGRAIAGTASRIDSSGALILETPTGEISVTLGDVEHATIV